MNAKHGGTTAPPPANGGVNRDRLLIVEDERLIAVDMMESLETMGYEVVDIASTGAEAIELAEEHAPDLVLMDIMLEGPMDGIETAAIIMERCRIPALFLTSHKAIDLLQRVKHLGPAGYILKPFNYRELEVNVALAIRNDRKFRMLRDSEHELRAANGELHRELDRHRSSMNEMAEVDSRLSSYLSTCPDGIFITRLDGVIEFVTPNAARLFHYPDERGLIGTGIHALLDGGDAERFDAYLHELFGGGEPIPFFCRGRSFDGCMMRIEMGSAVIRDGAGVANALFFIVRDMAGWKRMEEDKLHTAEEAGRKLQMQLESKISELATQSVFLLQANEFHRSLVRDLMKIKLKAGTDHTRSALQSLVNKITQQIDRRVWDEFRARFEHVHPKFYQTLNILFPNLSLNEIKLCAFSRLNLSSKEIAELTFKSNNSVKVARSRLRTKMGIGSEKEFYTFLVQI